MQRCGRKMHGEDCSSTTVSLGHAGRNGGRYPWHPVSSPPPYFYAPPLSHLSRPRPHSPTRSDRRSVPSPRRAGDTAHALGHGRVVGFSYKGCQELSGEFSEDLKMFVGNLLFSDNAQLARLFDQADSQEMQDVALVVKVEA